jgi:hypothetical protein
VCIVEDITDNVRNEGGCNPSYSGGRAQEDHSLKPVQANSS